MADPEKKDICLLKRTKISVFVDEALPDMIVVTYEFGVKSFKGILLDATKKNLPYGVQTLNPALNVPIINDDDALYAANQRFAYTDTDTDPSTPKKKNVNISSKLNKTKMTVRLRPRQVLCTKCKGICSENSENVTRKRKPPEPIRSPPLKRSANAPITRSVNVELNKKKIEVKRTLMPKAPRELPNALSGNVNKLNIVNNKKPLVVVSNLNCSKATCDSSVKTDPETNSIHSEEHSDVSNSSVSQKVNDPKLKRLPKKKRSVDSVEDLWDEPVLDKGANKNNNVNAQNNANQSDVQAGTCSNTRTIKICYGPQGEGTVLKIPAQIENLNDDNLEENVNLEEKDNQKAVRKAMKKAKKEAKRKIIRTSPDVSSPRYSAGGSSPRYTVGSASPRHGLGNHSPRYVATSPAEVSAPKKRKHKMKHKKKHKDDKDRKHSKEEEGNNSDEEVPKELFAMQKLSINLKRLSTSYSTQTSPEEKTEESSSDESSENSTIMLPISGESINSSVGFGDCCIKVGDIIWGKMGLSWWPGKILTITICGNDEHRAWISWYCSENENSDMECKELRPYLDYFKVHHNKKARGSYKDAIKQASTEAKVNAEQSEDVSSTARSITPVVPHTLASPREINVIS